MSDNEWDDEKTVLQAPKYIMIGRVVKDYIPEKSGGILTLLLDELVYVFKKESTEGPGFWEGETRGEYGAFPADHIVEVKA